MRAGRPACRTPALHFFCIRRTIAGIRPSADRDIVVNPALSVVAAHRMAVDAEHNLIDTSPRVIAALVHTATYPTTTSTPTPSLAGHLDEQAVT